MNVRMSSFEENGQVVGLRYNSLVPVSNIAFV